MSYFRAKTSRETAAGRANSVSGFVVDAVSGRVDIMDAARGGRSRETVFQGQCLFLTGRAGHRRLAPRLRSARRSHPARVGLVLAAAAWTQDGSR